MLRVLGLVSVVLALAGGSWPALAQPRDLSRVRVLAVAPFGDAHPLDRALAERGAARLSELLKGGRLQVIDAARVASEMRRLGVSPADLTSPTRAVTLGMHLGADAVMTGRIVQITQEIRRERKDSLIGISIEGQVAVDFRILEVGTRLILLQEEVACYLPALAAQAMECVVREVAARVRAAQN